MVKFDRSAYSYSGWWDVVRKKDQLLYLLLLAMRCPSRRTHEEEQKEGIEIVGGGEEI
jgi:hypothetical protein